MESLTIDRLFADILRAAEVVGITSDGEALRPVLEAYRDRFCSAAVSLRFTTLPLEKRDVSPRYLDFDYPHDPYQTALDCGFIQPEGHPIEEIMPLVQDSIPLLGYGVDASLRHGFEKIWPFFARPVPMDEIYEIGCLPDSIRAHADYLAGHGLNQISLFAIDYRRRSINLYFMMPDPQFLNPEKVAAMISDLGFSVPDDEHLAHSTRTAVAYYTFAWESPRVERISFAMGAPAVEYVPVHWHPLLERIVEQVPVFADRRQFIYNTTFAHSGDYYKIEVDYTATELLALQRVLQSAMV